MKDNERINDYSSYFSSVEKKKKDKLKPRFPDFGEMTSNENIFKSFSRTIATQRCLINSTASC